ncbi:telomere repeat-binding factor 4-like [Impatiens glandulifera]|uniref:telomere repeat-binding factor 4-like n=1 Tax=Impatiens glandulifera TaxID=253017 RepID=UPI001FB06C88|nr:telomere repeat-binding factor 4-like [Impatiens glandulifera]
MGNQKLKWTSEEEDALKAGIAKHGTGKWKNILKDPDFAHSLIHRSNIDLKDKWRNMSISTSLQGGGGGGGSKEKVKICRSKTLALYPLPNIQNSASASAVALVPDEDMADDPPKSMQETTKNAPAAPGHHQSMVFEALAALKNPNGSDIGTIVNYIEQRHEIPQNFRRLLSSKLRRLVMKGKLEKVQNCYKIASTETATAPAPVAAPAPVPAQVPIQATPIKMVPPRQKDVRAARLVQNMSAEETMEEAALSAAYMIVESENKSFVAAEAVREAERVAKLNEDSESLLQLVKEIYEKCSRGEKVRLAV